MIGGRYALRAAVGHGGMGTVWRAADTLLRRDVAVKEVISPPGLAPSDRDAMYERTLREARAAAALSHPAVVQVYDVVTENGRPWIVMELLDARSLADMVIEDGPLAPRAVAKIGIALLGALEVAHAAGVLHRDVKPANVLIASDGRCVLTDFGVARMPTDVQLTTPGMVLGSPHFISPERAMGQAFGPPSDLFSLGVTLFTAVEGRPPFDKGDPIETMHAVVEDPPAPMARSGVLSNVLYGLLEKEPSRRFDVATARTMLRELLSGPLASQAPAHMMTDPYAIVPAQRTPKPAPAVPPQPKPTGEIGGRAMLKPGESLTDRLKQVQAASADTTQPVSAKQSPSKPGGGHRRAAEPAKLDQTSPNLGGQPWDVPTGAAPMPSAGPTGSPPGFGGGATTTVVRPVSGPGGPGMPGGMHPGMLGGMRGGLPPLPGGGPSSPTGGAGSALATVRRTGDQLATAVRGWSRTVQIAAAAGVAAVLLLGIVIIVNSGDDQPASRPPVAQGSVAPESKAPTQRFADRGIAVNVPAGWKRSESGSYVDFKDPDGSGRRVRLLTEKAAAEPARFMEIAENGLKKSKNCAKPYSRIDLRDVELAGQSAAELEYTCGEGGNMRHGLWRAIVVDGKARSFYLTTPEGRFTESKPIFDEMVRSFQLTA